VGAGILLSRLVGLVSERAVGHFFGDSAAADAFRAAVAALPEFPVVFRYGSEDDGTVDAVDVHLTDTVTTTTALNLGAVVGVALVQLHAEGWAARWEPVGTPGGSSLVGRIRVGAEAEPG
jgi:coenzyme F420-0:L-glutamate ligase/coenzyme F420-1:gamma-L-glutamate ligase